MREHLGTFAVNKLRTKIANDFNKQLNIYICVDQIVKFHLYTVNVEIKIARVTATRVRQEFTLPEMSETILFVEMKIIFSLHVAKKLDTGYQLNKIMRHQQ